MRTKRESELGVDGLSVNARGEVRLTVCFVNGLGVPRRGAKERVVRIYPRQWKAIAAAVAKAGEAETR